MRLIDWLEDGKEFMGRDEHGEKMYSLTNGERLIVSSLMAAGVVALVIVAVLLARLVVGFVFGG